MITGSGRIGDDVHFRRSLAARCAQRHRQHRRHFEYADADFTTDDTNISPNISSRHATYATLYCFILQFFPRSLCRAATASLYALADAGVSEALASRRD